MSTPEADIVYNQTILDRYFIVVGMSFECESDRLLLRALARVEDDLPIGESSWLIVNRHNSVLKKTVDLIQIALPHAKVSGVRSDLID